MNPFDAGILHFVNGFANRSWTADYVISWLNNDGFQKGGIVMMLFWGAWFLSDERSGARREILICTAVAAPLAVGVSRIISAVVPFRVRPLFVADLHMRVAYTLAPRTLINWNSFPSDHAVLFFALAEGLFLASRRIGAAAFTYALLIVCLPRIYLGIHYPTDIIAGAFLGAAIGYAACRPTVRSAVGRPVLRWMTAYPAVSYAFLFFYTYQVANAFGWVRDVFCVATHVISGYIAKCW